MKKRSLKELYIEVLRLRLAVLNAMLEKLR